MKRVTIVGTSCSGKTTLARQISSLLQIPHIELDAMYWGPNWSPTPTEEFRSAIAHAVDHERWIVDGNYGKAQDIVWHRATHLIWLNYPFPIVFWRALRRTLKRISTQEELFSGNRETIKNVFLDGDSILWWVVRTHHRYRKKYRILIAKDDYRDLKIIELSRPSDAHKLLRSIKEHSY